LIIRKLIIFVVLSQLSGCMSIPQTRPFVDQVTKQQAKTFPRYAEFANVYIQRPYSSRWTTYYDVFIDDKQVTQLQIGQSTNLKAAPGLYRFRVSEPENEYKLGVDLVAEFELELQAGGQVFLTCGDNREWDASDRFMLPAQACGEGGERRWVTQNGVKFCGQPKPDFKSKRELEWHGVVYSRVEFNNCRLLKDSSRFMKATYEMHDNHAHMVASDVEIVTPMKGMAASSKSTVAKAVPVAAKQKSVTSPVFAALKKSESCKLVNTHWAYTGESCKGGLATGKGSAEDNQGLKFIGSFANGKRVEGDIYQNEEMIFSGKLVDDKPHGNAVCLHEGEYEECRYFKGKRIDTLYKIRKENDKMRADMKRNKQARPISTYSSSQSSSVTDYAVNAAQKEATDRAVNYIFDSLF